MQAAGRSDLPAVSYAKEEFAFMGSVVLQSEKRKTLGQRFSELKPQTRDNLVGYAFLLPNFLGCLLFTILPVAFSLVVSFTDWDYTKGFGNWNFTGLTNYIDLIHDDIFLTSLINTLVYTIAVVPITILLAMVLSVLVDKFCFAKLPIRLAMLMPYISNVVAVAIVWVMMYSSFGPVTLLVKALGIENPPQWLADYTWAMPAVILMTIWSNVGYSALIYASALQGLPQDVYEAADIDGAGEFTKFFRLTVPFLSPTTFFLVITNLITSFQVFAPIQIMTRGGPGTSTYVLVYYIYRSAFGYYKMGYASAMAWVLFLLIFIVTVIQWRHQNKVNNY